MNDILDIEIILKRNKYPKIYNISLIILAIISIFIYVIFTYKYQSYYQTKGKIQNNELIVIVDLNDLKYFVDNTILLIDNQEYSYQVNNIDDNIYIDDNYNNYTYIHLKVSMLKNINNYVYEIKVKKENKTLAKYLKEYL